jgi:chromosome segregation ATPase
MRRTPQYVRLEGSAEEVGEEAEGAVDVLVDVGLDEVDEMEVELAGQGESEGKRDMRELSAAVEEAERDACQARGALVEAEAEIGRLRRELEESYLERESLQGRMLFLMEQAEGWLGEIRAVEEERDVYHHRWLQAEAVIGAAVHQLDEAGMPLQVGQGALEELSGDDTIMLEEGEEESGMMFHLEE